MNCAAVCMFHVCEMLLAKLRSHFLHHPERTQESAKWIRASFSLSFWCLLCLPGCCFFSVILVDSFFRGMFHRLAGFINFLFINKTENASFFSTQTLGTIPWMKSENICWFPSRRAIKSGRSQLISARRSPGSLLSCLQFAIKRLRRRLSCASSKMIIYGVRLINFFSLFSAITRSPVFGVEFEGSSRDSPGTST